MPQLRSFRPGDEPALADICLRTADAGGDGTGILADDDLWGHVFVLPYAARHPDLAFVVESDDGRVAFRYCDARGDTHEAANINGSLNHIAGIYSEKLNVLGMMPHPENLVEALMGGTDGLPMFKGLAA